MGRYKSGKNTLLPNTPFFADRTAALSEGTSKRILDAEEIVTPNQGIRRSGGYGIRMAIRAGLIVAVFNGVNDFLARFWLPLQMGVVRKPPAVDYSAVNVMSHLLGSSPTTPQQFWILDALYWGLVNGLMLGLAAGLYCGGAAYVQHFVLRFLLWHGKSLPFNYPRFLNDAVSRMLLRKVGGGYCFFHGLLLEHFAALDTNYHRTEPDCS